MSKNTKNKKYYLLIPEKLIPRLNIIEYNPLNIPGFRISYLKEIIYLICTRTKEDGFAYLKMAYLKKIVPQAEQYIKFLMNDGIIERTPFYQPGFRSFGYRFSAAYSSNYKELLLTDNKLIRRIITKGSSLALARFKQQRLIEDLNIDSEAEAFAEKYYTGESYNYAISSITRIKNNDKFSILDDTSGRFHSNLTSMPKELRSFVTINNKHLKANVDIKNSQPYLSTILLTNPRKVANFAKDPSLRMILENLYVPNNEDIEKYIYLVTNGKFYEFLITHFESQGLISPTLNFREKRDEIKKKVMVILYDQERKRVSLAKQLFAELFPSVAEIFNKIRGKTKGNHFQGYQRFAILLQTIEAYLVLKVILKRIFAEHPRVIALTIHDSILTTDNVEIVQRIMMEELKKFVGYPPVLKIEEI